MRPLRGVPGVLVVACAALGGSAAPAAAAAPSASCPPKRAVLELATKQAQVWHVRRGRRAGWYACRTARSKAIALGDFDDLNGGTRSIRLAGRFVAYERSVCSRTDGVCVGAIVVRDVARRLTRRAPIPPLGGPLAALAVSERGAAVWVRAAASGPQQELRVLDAAGERAVAAGADIDSESLAVGPTTAYWTQGGTPNATALGAW